MHGFEIIDFHTHPFMQDETNICPHKQFFEMSAETTPKTMKALGITKICGSVICVADREKKGEALWSAIRKRNDEALRLKELYGGYYVPGFHVHPAFVRESCEEIERMHKLGVRLIGELVPYLQGWSEYATRAFDEILDLAAQYDMVVSYHSMPDEDDMDRLVKNHKKLTLVAAHPGETAAFSRQLERMKLSENFYLDLSGQGLFRHGMLKHGIEQFGAERFLFGSDYPTCSPAMYVGGVLLDSLISDSQKEMIFSKNAKRILNL